MQSNYSYNNSQQQYIERPNSTTFQTSKNPELPQYVPRNFQSNLTLSNEAGPSFIVDGSRKATPISQHSFNRTYNQHQQPIYLQNPQQNQQYLYQQQINRQQQQSNYNCYPSHSSKQKSFEKLADVYSENNDSLKFASNLCKFFDENIPTAVWMVFSAIQILYGLVSLFVGTFNWTSCYIERNIPVYLLLSGIILIINGSVRLCLNFSSATQLNKGNNRNQAKSSFGVSAFCRIAMEGTILFIIIAVVVLGCVWVYGAKYVQFNRYQFERNYCDYFLYWFSWWSVTIHLIVFSTIIIILIVILVYGAMTEK